MSSVYPDLKLSSGIIHQTVVGGVWLEQSTQTNGDEVC